MKIKVSLIGLLLTLSGANMAHAATEITGEVHGEIFQVMDMNDAGALYGVSIDDVGNTSEDCNEVAQTCNVKGFSWSDVVGWTFWDGLQLQTELGGAINFPDEYIAKVTYDGEFSGYIWGEKFGWIKLSSGTGPIPEVGSQDVNDWGIYLDLCPLKVSQASCESVDSNPYCNWDALESQCVFDSVANPNGHPLRGYAWSEYLGWIKFNPEDAAEQATFAGAFTNWFPDLTPPDLTAQTNAAGVAWIPNESGSNTITWQEFIEENESFVSLSGSKVSSVTVTADGSPDFLGCPPSTTGIIDPTGTGEVDLVLPNLGLLYSLPRPPYGFCKYDLTGVIYNSAGIGYYFGSNANALAIADGVDPSNPLPAGYNDDSITLLIRAGDLAANTTSVAVNGNNAVADGSNTMEIVFNPTDIGDNPIVSVQADLNGNIIPGDPGNWVRNVEFLYDFSDSFYVYDGIDWVRDVTITSGKPAPIEIEGENYINTNLLRYPSDGTPFNFAPEATGEYRLYLTGYAPSNVGGSNSLILNEINFNTNDQALPAVSPSQGPWSANFVPLAINSSTYPALMPPADGGHLLNYDPLVEVTNATLNPDFLSLSVPAEATFTFQNNDTNAANDITEYAFDHILNFHDTSFGAELMDVEDINLNGLLDTAGRTDPNGAATRYGLVYSSVDSAQLNEFHSSTNNFHSPTFSFEYAMDSNGLYQVNGNAYVEPDDPCIGAGNCPLINIDRSDLLNTGDLVSTVPTSYTFSFTPSRFFASSSTGAITLDINEYASYNYLNNLHGAWAVLYPPPTFIQDKEVKTIGIDTSGIVGGQQIYDSVGGRDFATITTSSADLRKEIRRNVATLTRNMTACTDATLASLSTNDVLDCISVDNTNGTVVAYYSDPGNVITLGNGSDIEVPNGYRYTLILEATDLNIENNIVYPNPADPNTSFGIIVIQDSNGDGGNVYLDPAPTNMVGLLYAEGSLLSSPDAGASFYYTSGGPSVNDLDNQLLWQGSIASRNTIGGANNNVIPDDVDCTAWDDAASCAQAYDLDFTRRFTITGEGGLDFVPAGTLFSGGGSCNIGALPDPDCNLGTLPTTISLTGTSIDTSNSKSLETFFIERDNRPVPPGFSTKAGLTSSQVIR